MHNETITNIFWGIFFIWFGFLAAYLQGDIGATLNSPIFALGTGVLFLILNLTRLIFHQKLSPVTIWLGILLTVIYSPIVFLHINLPFLPALLVMVGVALIIGAIRGRAQ